MLSFPNAKINIGLRIINKRLDGFHNIESILYPVGLSDFLEFIPIKEDKGKTISQFINTGIKITSEHKINICLQAFNLMKNKFKLPDILIHLHKNIPIGAGLGGGSSDASFMIKSLNDYFNLNLSTKEMEGLAAQIGSDCPFFIKNIPAIVYEKGEKLKKISLNLSGYYLILIYPGIIINTGEAYSKIRIKNNNQSLEELIRHPIEKWKNNIHNDFEEVIFNIYPQINDIKDKLYRAGAIYSSLSGSGSVVYGIFEQQEELIKNLFEEYFIWEQKL